jgi:hypothetical protein
VREHREGHGWIPAGVEPGAPLPLDAGELADLYHSSRALGEHEEREIEGHLPDPRTLPSPPDFGRLVESLGASEPGELAAFWNRPPAAGDLPHIATLQALLVEAAAELSRLEPWQRRVVAAGHGGGAERQLWIDLRDQVREAAARWEAARPVLLERDVQLDGAPPIEEVRQHSIAIGAHLERGGKLGTLTLLFRADWKTVIRTVRVNGQSPAHAADFRAIAVQAELDEGRRKLAARWARQAEPEGLPAFAAVSQPPEPILREYAEQFEGLLGWWDQRWSAIAAAMEQAGFRWIPFREREVARSAPTAPFEQDARLLAAALPEAVRARGGGARRDQAGRRLAAFEDVLDRFTGPVCDRLLAAVRARDVAGTNPPARRSRPLRRSNRSGSAGKICSGGWPPPRRRGRPRSAVARAGTAPARFPASRVRRGAGGSSRRRSSAGQGWTMWRSPASSTSAGPSCATRRRSSSTGWPGSPSSCGPISRRARRCRAGRTRSAGSAGGRGGACRSSRRAPGRCWRKLAPRCRSGSCRSPGSPRASTRAAGGSTSSSWTRRASPT